MFDILSVFISLGLLIFLIWRKTSIVIAAPLSAAFLALLNGLNVFDALTSDYMTSMANFVMAQWPLFLLSATFAKAMGLSGASNDVANLLTEKIGSKHAMKIVIFTALLLAYGGVSAFVIVFAVYPIALILWEKSNLPRELIPAAIAAGAFTAPNLLPGSPALINVLPIQFLGSSATGAPLLAMIGSVTIFGLAYSYMMYAEKRARKNGKGFEADEKVLKIMEEARLREVGNGYKALIPMLMVVGLTFAQVNILIAMIVGTLAIAILYWNKITDKLQIVNGGLTDAMTAVINTSAAVGFGGVLAITAGFATLIDFAVNFQGPPLLSFGATTAMLAGAAGSGSGGMALSLGYIAEEYLAMGINPEVLHRIASIASVTLDTLPHNGVIVTLLAVTGLTHKQSYKYLFMVTIIVPVITLFVMIFFGSVLY